MKENFLVTLGINFIVTVVTSILSFVGNRYFVLNMGLETYGLMKLFTQLLAYLNLAEIGLASASAYALYKPLSERDYHHISVIMNTISELYKKIFYFVLFTGILFTPIIPFFIKDKINYTHIYIYWILYVVATALTYRFAKYMTLFSAAQRYGLVRLIQGSSRIFCQILQILSLIYFSSFSIFIAIFIFDNLIQYFLYRRYYNRDFQLIYQTEEREIKIIKDLKNLFWHKVAALVVFNTDLILISKFISLNIVGIYASYLMVLQVIQTMLNIVINVLRPKIGNYIARHEDIKIFHAFLSINILFLYVSMILSLCIFYLIDDFMMLWLKEDVVLPKITLILILINFFIQCFRNNMEMFKEGYGYFKDIHLPILEAAINLCFSLIFVFSMGLNGVILGTIFSNILIIMIAKPIVTFKNCFHKTVKEYISIYIKYLFLVFTSMILVRFIRMDTFVVIKGNWYAWIQKSTLIFFMTSFLLFLVFLTDKYFREIWMKGCSTLKYILKRKN